MANKGSLYISGGREVLSSLFFWMLICYKLLTCVGRLLKKKVKNLRHQVDLNKQAKLCLSNRGRDFLKGCSWVVCRCPKRFIQFIQVIKRRQHFAKAGSHPCGLTTHPFKLPWPEQSSQRIAFSELEPFPQLLSIVAAHWILYPSKLLLPHTKYIRLNYFSNSFP